MPNVKVSPIQQIKVRVNQGNQQTVHNTIQFIGSQGAQDQINQALSQSALALSTANSAYIYANNAYMTANTKYDKTGGLISGDVSISGSLTANTQTIDAGTF
jgi:hypothetical protein